MKPREEWTDQERECFEAGRAMARELAPLTPAEVETLRQIIHSGKRGQA